MLSNFNRIESLSSSSISLNVDSFNKRTTAGAKEQTPTKLGGPSTEGRKKFAVKVIRARDQEY
jgi:hypothetical protein